MGKQEGKKLTKEERNSEGMRPLRYGPRGPRRPPPRERGGGGGCAWRDTECCGLGRWKEEEIGLKGCLFILNGQMFRGQEYALPHTDRLSFNL